MWSMAAMDRLQKCERPSFVQGGGVYVDNGEAFASKAPTFTDIAVGHRLRAAHLRHAATVVLEKRGLISLGWIPYGDQDFLMCFDYNIWTKERLWDVPPPTL